jgi:hypothetical protein
MGEIWRTAVACRSPSTQSATSCFSEVLAGLVPPATLIANSVASWTCAHTFQPEWPRHVAPTAVCARPLTSRLYILYPPPRHPNTPLPALITSHLHDLELRALPHSPRRLLTPSSVAWLKPGGRPGRTFPPCPRTLLPCIRTSPPSQRCQHAAHVQTERRRTPLDASHATPPPAVPLPIPDTLFLRRPPGPRLVRHRRRCAARPHVTLINHDHACSVSVTH